MIDPMIAPSAKARGFAIGRIVSHWHDIVGDMSSGAAQMPSPFRVIAARMAR